MRFTPQLRQLSWLVDRPIAHRGLHDQRAPENSSLAFAAAINRNYSIECDLQLSADGEAMVFHDDNLDRMTTASGPVRHLKARELSALRIGDQSATIQTLGELLDQVAGRVPLVIEIKSHWDHRLELLARAIKVLNSYKGPFAIMSFDPDIVQAASVWAQHVVRGIVADRVTDSYYQPLSVKRRLGMRQFSHWHKTRPDFVSFDAAGMPFAPVQRVRQMGLPVITWTIRSEAEASRVRRYADQITFEGYLPQ